ncbi:MAG TPA: tetratricopeptide repeat protein [Bacteriovoracaceae bacterium]|nr:tetratricopeptide repeat protein [Bacteriovoracaceae bacterium]
MIKIPLLSLLILSSCASVKKDAPESDPNAAFNKEKPLKTSEVPKYIENTPQSVNPALMDETTDRYSNSELAELKETNDPLIDIAVKCSQEDFKGAFALASNSFNKYQNIASYWNIIGNCHLNQGSPRKALLFYNKAIEVKANYVPAMNNIGVLYSRQGEKQKALVAFEKANKLAKFSKTPRYNLAKLYLSFGLAEEALVIFQGLLSSSPEDLDLLNTVASCYVLMSNYQEAFSHYQRIPRAQWTKPEVGLNLALTLKKIGKDDEAMSVFKGLAETKSPALKKYQVSIGTQLGEKE